MATVIVGWSGDYTKIDETTADDSDYVRSHVIPLEGVTTATMEVGLSTISDPSTGLAHRFRARAKKNSGGGYTIGFTIALKEGSNTRASATFSNIGSAFKTYEYTLSSAEADAITDYSNLSLLFTFTATGSGGSRAGLISWAEFEAPTP